MLHLHTLFIDTSNSKTLSWNIGHAMFWPTKWKVIKYATRTTTRVVGVTVDSRADTCGDAADEATSSDTVCNKDRESDWTTQYVTIPHMAAFMEPTLHFRGPDRSPLGRINHLSSGWLSVNNRV